MQDAAYGMLLRAKRQDLHARIARVLQAQFLDVCENQPEILARHCTQAGLAQQAITYWQRAGNRAAKQSANQEAVAHFRNAKELLEALPDRAAHAEQELPVLAEQIEDGLRLVREAADQAATAGLRPNYVDSKASCFSRQTAATRWKNTEPSP